MPALDVQNAVISTVTEVKTLLEQARGVVGEIDQGFSHLKASVDLTEVMAAKEAVGSLATAIRDTLNLGGDKTTIGLLFDRIAQAANAAVSCDVPTTTNPAFRPWS